jgi:hypothetical protein
MVPSYGDEKHYKEMQLFRHDAERNHPYSNRAIPLTNCGDGKPYVPALNHP